MIELQQNQRKLDDQESIKELAVTSASPSYLQTLPNDQAGTFLDALQKVKDHLSNELQSLNQQVQQKTMQLQGIEALLAEAQAKESAQETPLTPAPEATPSNLLTAPILPGVLADNSQERPSANCATASDDASTIEAVLLHLPLLQLGSRLRVQNNLLLQKLNKRQKLV